MSSHIIVTSWPHLTTSTTIFNHSHINIFSLVLLQSRGIRKVLDLGTTETKTKVITHGHYCKARQSAKDNCCRSWNRRLCRAYDKLVLAYFWLFFSDNDRRLYRENRRPSDCKQVSSDMQPRAATAETGRVTAIIVAVVKFRRTSHLKFTQ